MRRRTGVNICSLEEEEEVSDEGVVAAIKAK
jgi:hypothetical protein